jgi:hypothetical protein
MLENRDLHREYRSKSPAAKRLLLRLWINLWEGRELAPRFADRYNAGAWRGVPTQASAP